MVNSIGSSDRYELRMQLKSVVQTNTGQTAPSRTSQVTPPPQGKGLLADLDTDSSGGISQTELEVLAKGISNVTGSAVDAKSTLSTYDKDGDGELSGEELHNVLTGSGIEPPPPPQTPSLTYNARGHQGAESNEIDSADPGDPTSTAATQSESSADHSEIAGQYASYQKLMMYLKRAAEKPKSIDTVA